MSKMISVASDFQYSVNIGYDLTNDNKLKNFIPTKSALELLEEILLSAASTSTNRARVLIGAYGKGKSHIVLMIMAMLMKRDLSLFEKVLPKIKENERLYHIVESYYESNNKILPVIISGSNTSLTQAFLLALQRTLADNDLLDVMPETNYKAAVSVINRWKQEFPTTYENFEKILDIPVDKFVRELENYNIVAYERFEQIYPTLTAGSIFNPFLGFDVVELYEGVAKSLKNKGFTGIYVIYDEFSKFLEANISEASVSDTKMLQDFAEKCNRSGSTQMHLLLISHKEISNYIDILPKQKIDGWRGVSERFSHIHLNNNFSQTYEIIASVIQKDEKLWHEFYNVFSNNFLNIANRYTSHAIFSEMEEKEIRSLVESCYPLHPVSTFILPRLSECVAQNERTLFTFLSAKGISTLPSFLDKYDDQSFNVITPDLIYDYFEPLFKKEPYSSDLYKTYQLTTAILSKVASNTIESKIIKTLSLTYILGQFEKLSPTKDELVGIFSVNYTVDEIEKAINHLIIEEYVIYLKRSNNYLRLKKTSGVDIHQKISDMVDNQKGKVSVKEILNRANFDKYIYPSRYNDEREMTRYFPFIFVDENEVSENTDWDLKSSNVLGDGIVYGIVPTNNERIKELKDILLISSKQTEKAVFVLPKKYKDISAVIAEFNAVSVLKEASIDDNMLFDEYEIVYEDLREVIADFIQGYTQPTTFKSYYIYNGTEKSIKRKAEFTGLLSDICDNIFSLTPTVNNEAINKDDITSIAYNSRRKIISGLLHAELENNLGLTGSGQEVSILRSTLTRTGILCNEFGTTKINLSPDDKLLSNVLFTIVEFIKESKKDGQRNFGELYMRLTNSQYKIGLRKGLIPIYLSAVIHEFKQNIVISDRFGQVTISADTILQINADPKAYFIKYLEWDTEKEVFIERLSKLFEEYVVDAERNISSYEYTVIAMRRWYMSLPKYSKEIKKTISGEIVDKRYLNFLRLLKQNKGAHEILFEYIPEVFGYSSGFNPGVLENITAAKTYFDNCVVVLKHTLAKEIKEIFGSSSNDNFDMISLSSTIKDWCETLDEKVFEQLFSDGTEKCLMLFKSITNDEDTFVARLAKLATDLRLEDWDDSIHEKFIRNIKQYKVTAEQYHVKAENNNFEPQDNNYQITFFDDSGDSITKRFERVEVSKRGNLLLNAIVSDVESMGHSITEQEKRQILMEVLKKLC